MRPSIVGVVILAPLVAACSSNTSTNNTQNTTANLSGAQAGTLYTVSAGPVTGNRAAGINGSFRITQTSAPDGIESDLLGGACIVFRAQDLGYTQMAQKTCHNDSQCKTGEGQAYCEASTQKCWSRPIVIPPAHDPLCRRSIDEGAPPQWPVDTDVMISDVAPIPVPSNLQPNAQALAIACLRGKGNGASTACGGPHSVVKWGSPTTIP